MRYKKEYIIEAVGLYGGGMSFTSVKSHMWQHHNVRVSRKTIWEWVRKYSKLLRDFTEKLRPKIKGVVHCDEVFLKVKGSQVYYWGAKDRKTRFRVASKLTKTRSYGGAKAIFHKMRYGCEGTPAKIVSDKLSHYRRGYNSYFYRQRSICKLVHGVPIACKKHGLRYNNNPIERDNQRIKQRTKPMRGFKNFVSAGDLLSFQDINYNYFTPHSALKWKTPAEVAGLDLNLGRNKLRGMIKTIFEFER